MHANRRVLLVSVAAVLSCATATRAAERGGSILVFPRVVADQARDTLVEITNGSNRRAYLRCRYVAADGSAATPFELVLNGQQPTHWVVARGRPVQDDEPCHQQSAACDGSGDDPGAIPPAPAFEGGLACVQTDRSGAPLSGNALRGRATLVDDADGDVASYAAFELTGFDPNDGDDVLCLDGLADPPCATIEYAGCPDQWSFVHAADGAPDPLDAAHRTVHGALSVLPCGLLVGRPADPLTVQVGVVNELGDLFAASAVLEPLAPTPLAGISDILTQATAGSDVVATRLSGSGSAGFLLIEESERRSAGDPPVASGRTADAGRPAGDGAAIVVLPHVIVDASRQVDTIVRLVNESDEPLAARCVYENATRACVGEGSADSCLPGHDGACSGGCGAGEYRTVEFDVALAAGQPLGWRVGVGRQPLPSRTSPITGVPAIASPFAGALRCIAVEPNGSPADRNALSGNATVETVQRAAGGAGGVDRLDAAQYDAIGLKAIPGSGDGDPFLVVGGADPEYESCGRAVALDHLFDDVVPQVGSRQDAVTTTLTLVPCAASLDQPEPVEDVVQMLIFNEFRQRFSTSRTVSGQLMSRLSAIDTNRPDRSVFNVRINGTVAGQTIIRGVSGGVMGVAIQAHAGAEGSSSAAFALHPAGARADADLITLRQVSCAGDCDGDRTVGVTEVVRGVKVLLGLVPSSDCLAFDRNDDSEVEVSELVQGITHVLDGCPPPAASPTPGHVPTPVATTAATSVGPELTFFGLVSGDDQPIEAGAPDSEGRAIFIAPHGQGFAVVIEARSGVDGSPSGVSAYAPEGTSLPDLQIIVDRALGDGSVDVCDADPPAAGGVPATEPFEFTTPNAVAAINDLGCRVDDGLGRPRQGGFNKVCAPLFDAPFLDPDSRVQFCLPVARAWAFPPGDTVVAARLRNEAGTIGPAREIVVRVSAP